jgi:steroid delta-isomerase-like uncharacterized protein
MDEVFNKHNLAAAEELLSEDFVDHNPIPGTGPDKAGTIQGFQMLLDAFPDMKAEIDHMIAGGDRVAIHCTITATHQDEYMGIPATGKSLIIGGIDIVKIRDQQATEHWGIYDAMGMMQQLGVMPAPPS